MLRMAFICTTDLTTVCRPPGTGLKCPYFGGFGLDPFVEALGGTYLHVFRLEGYGGDEGGGGGNARSTSDYAITNTHTVQHTAQHSTSQHITAKHRVCHQQAHRKKSARVGMNLLRGKRVRE